MNHQDQNEQHEYFEELCALAMSDNLDERERASLEDHWKSCEECRTAFREYQMLATEGIPHLAYLGGVTDSALVAPGQGSDFSVRNWWNRTLSSSKPILWAAAAVIVMLVSSGVIMRWQHKQEVTSDERSAAAGRQLQVLTKERAGLEAEVSSQEKKIQELEYQSEAQKSEIARLHSKVTGLEEYARQLATGKSASEAQVASVLEQRDRVLGQLADLEKKYQEAQLELGQQRSGRDRTLLKVTSLESQVNTLLQTNREQERQLRLQEQFLASDRDVRELMGARQLLMADVFDVSSDSRTKKPYGRVFYTKGKSLIFYAFDLDRQPGVKNATFQAWGRNESQPKPINLGILYIDNEANRRWALHFDDPKLLAEIDSVFVTVEPHGGSTKPTGKPFLYASLRREVNHP